MIFRSSKSRAQRRIIVSGARGFTLIELLVVVGIVSLLVAIALPRYTRARRQAHRSEMQSDLRNLLSAEEAYFDDYYSYTTNLAVLEFNTTPNVTIQFVDASSSGWSARATHVNTSAQCGVYVGTSTMPSGVPVAGEGAVSCTEAN